jgi:hypothetical protein
MHTAGECRATEIRHCELAMESRPAPQLVIDRTVSLCFQTCTATGAVLAFQYSSGLSLILALVLATYLCDSAIEACADRLIAPFWQRVRGCQPAQALNSACLDPTSTHRLCTLPQNKRHSYATPNRRISRSRAPPECHQLPHN